MRVRGSRAEVLLRRGKERVVLTDSSSKLLGIALSAEERSARPGPGPPPGTASSCPPAARPLLRPARELVGEGGKQDWITGGGSVAGLRGKRQRANHGESNCARGTACVREKGTHAGERNARTAEIRVREGNTCITRSRNTWERTAYTHMHNNLREPKWVRFRTAAAHLGSA
ncbi:hypothetical protein NDU88_003346 [Pleurodeles waltl]|uniref:Uncharacterized protein n=1 Tax=Pleurodeles waltl TaxID=8319 RepID=A0AAV7W5B7_PLEWA|nr:hypothetical protein NDU88_003346 [Pleurodeles waltl]